MTDLSLVSDIDLWRELAKRCDAAILVTLKLLDDKTERAFVSYAGGRYTCAGLAMEAQNELMTMDDADHPNFEE